MAAIPKEVYVSKSAVVPKMMDYRFDNMTDLFKISAIKIQG